MKVSCPRVIIAGTGSGVGKTSVTLALIAALKKRGLRVQSFKVGPGLSGPDISEYRFGKSVLQFGWLDDRSGLCSRAVCRSGCHC